MGYIITANLARGRKVTVPEVFQWNRGQQLRFTGIELPDTYRVDFSNTMLGDSKSVVGGADGVTIPDEYFVPGQTIYAWLVFSPNENASETEYQVSIPISQRAKPTDAQPNPPQQDVIDQLIGQMTEAAEKAEDAKEAIENMGVASETLEPLQDATVEKTVDPETGEITLNFGIPKGYSPTVDINPLKFAEIETRRTADGMILMSIRRYGTQITFTDIDGQETANVMDGWTPTVRIDNTGNWHTMYVLYDPAKDIVTATWKDGTTFTPSVSPEGVISWTNDGGLANPESVDIKGQQGDPGTPGFSPTATVTKSGNTATISITDANGTTTASVTDGENGTPGVDGTTFTPSVSEQGVISWTNNGGLPNPQSVNIKGPKGDDGISPVATVTKSGDTVTITVMDKDGTTTATISDGQDGNDYVLTAQDKQDIAGMVDAPVQDVQIGSTSILSNGVAKIKIKSSTPLIFSQANGLSVETPGNADIKAGTTWQKALTPELQHASVFYGLAKAAGDSTQSSSSNSVGTYTEDAKSKISDMLNAPVAVSGSTPSITAKAGIRYICGEVSTLSVTVPASGCVDVRFESGSTPTVLTVTPPTGMTMKWPDWFDPTSLDANRTYEINILDGVYGVVTSWAT